MSNVQYPISNFAIGYSTLDIYVCPMNWLTSPETWIALLTLTVLEIVLGIDNIIFISILAGKLPAGEQLTGQDRDENDVVDAEDDLEHREREQRDPGFGRGEPGHGPEGEDRGKIMRSVECGMRSINGGIAR